MSFMLLYVGPVSSVVQGNSGIFSSDGNVVSLADGRLPSTSRFTGCSFWTLELTISDV